MIINRIHGEVIAERRRQDKKWGGYKHDDKHSIEDFATYIKHYAGWAWQMGSMNSPLKARKRLIQIAALAIAAVEMIDRKYSKPTIHEQEAEHLANMDEG